MVEAAGGRNVWIVGGGDLAGQFADAGLLDEVIVSIAPVTLGGGCAAPAAPDRAPSGGVRTERGFRVREVLGRASRLKRGLPLGRIGLG
jgi:dihydrofolate reductase